MEENSTLVDIPQMHTWVTGRGLNVRTLNYLGEKTLLTYLSSGDLKLYVRTFILGALS